MNKYDVAWEFTALGVSSLDLPIILEGHNEGEKLQAIRLQQRDNLEKKRGRPFGTHKISLKSTLKEMLRAKSDDEGDIEVCHAMCISMKKFSACLN